MISDQLCIMAQSSFLKTAMTRLSRHGLEGKLPISAVGRTWAKELACRPSIGLSFKMLIRASLTSKTKVFLVGASANERVIVIGVEPEVPAAGAVMMATVAKEQGIVGSGIRAR